MSGEAKVRWVEVTEDEAGQRIDNYLLARLKGVPKSHVYRIARSGEVRINSKRVQASRKIAAGDRIRVPPVRVAKRAAADGGKRVSVSDEGQEAETIFRLLERRDDASLLEAELLTGRTHQIRVHLAHLKHPVLGDDRYGDFELNRALRKRGLKRMFLHAARLAFAHPARDERMVIESKLPGDLSRFWERSKAA